MMKPEPPARPRSWRLVTLTTAGLTALASSTQLGADVLRGVTVTACSFQTGAGERLQPGGATSMTRARARPARPAAGHAQREWRRYRFMGSSWYAVRR